MIHNALEGNLRNENIYININIYLHIYIYI